MDFVLQQGEALVAIEGKSGRGRQIQPGLENFASKFPTHRKLLVGGGGMPLERFLCTPVQELF